MVNHYQLAEHLHMTVTELLQTMPEKEYRGWLIHLAQKAKDAE